MADHAFVGVVQQRVLADADRVDHLQVGHHVQRRAFQRQRALRALVDVDQVGRLRQGKGGQGLVLGVHGGRSSSVFWFCRAPGTSSRRRCAIPGATPSRFPIGTPVSLSKHALPVPGAFFVAGS
ncbi:hypothetical protein D3C72_1927660 [compost metagenome]